MKYVLSHYLEPSIVLGIQDTAANETLSALEKHHPLVIDPTTLNHSIRPQSPTAGVFLSFYQIQCSPRATGCSKIFTHFNTLKTHQNPRSYSVLMSILSSFYICRSWRIEGHTARKWHRLLLCYVSHLINVWALADKHRETYSQFEFAWDFWGVNPRNDLTVFTLYLRIGDYRLSQSTRIHLLKNTMITIIIL